MQYLDVFDDIISAVSFLLETDDNFNKRTFFEALIYFIYNIFGYNIENLRLIVLYGNAAKNVI